MVRLVIEPVGLHWLYDLEPGADLCAHGGIRMIFDQNIIFEAGAEGDGYTLSAAALHLLRTAERDYQAGETASGQLVPCCGNLMFFDAALGEVVNQPCPNGIDWRIAHSESDVSVCVSDGVQFVVSREEWREAVHAFSSQVRVFYFASPRVVNDELDATWHPYFVREWNEWHEATR